VSRRRADASSWKQLIKGGFGWPCIL